MTKKDLIKILKPLIEANTVNPPGNEHRAASIIERFFRANEIPFKKYEKEKGRTNIVGKVGNAKKGPKLMIDCHMDTVPVGKDWKTDPFKLVEKNGTFYGRGVCDNKGQLAAMLLAAKELKRTEGKLKGQIIFVGGADEEKGSSKGLHWLIEKGYVKPDMGIIPDVTGFHNIITAQKRLLHLKVSVKGKSAHGATPSQGKSAIMPMVKFLNALDQHKFKTKPNKYFRCHTMNIGTIRGGNAVNMVPDHCECEIDFRLIKNQTKSYILGELKKIASKIKEARFRFEESAHIEYAETDTKSSVIKASIRAIEKIHGKKPELLGIGGTTDSKALTLRGIPVADVSVGGKAAHKPDENVKAEELLKLAKFLVEVSNDLLV